MITNERQYKITRTQLEKLLAAVNKFDTSQISNQVGSDLLARAELEALRSEAEVLQRQVDEYEALQSGVIGELRASSLDELPRIMIQARIAQRLSQRELGDRIGVQEQQIQRYESTEYSSASLRRLLQIADALELDVAELAMSPKDQSSAFEKLEGELDWSKFPVREMYRRGWFEGFTGSLDVAVQEAENLTRAYVSQVIRRPSIAFHRKRVRSGSSIDEYALMAWECRILWQGMKTELGGEFRIRELDSEWFAGLVKQSAKSDGPLRAKDMLQEVGIALVIEPHMTKTHLDGAALLHGANPLIGMTLRYDRLDNFWFVLLHELFHVVKHLRKGKMRQIFDDLDATGVDVIETEADELARDTLLPPSAWEHALARYVQTPELVHALADELGISPTIIAGRIRKEANNYVILSELVGQREVRRHFPDIHFGT